jgi:hypothetical protein
MNILVALTAGIALVNVALLVALLTIYGRIYKNTKASFTIGLMFFAGMLMLHNIIAVYTYFGMESLYSMELLPFFVVIHFAELTGIAVLVKVTLGIGVITLTKKAFSTLISHHYYVIWINMIQTKTIAVVLTRNNRDGSGSAAVSTCETAGNLYW